jgi:hypothetical protein
VQLGTAGFRLTPGATKAIAIRLPRGAERLADKRHRLTPKLRGESRDSAGNLAASTTAVTLRVPAKRS